MKLHNPPSPFYAFGYKTPPQSGNEINGLGVKEKVPAKHVFHDPGDGDLAWKALDAFFSYISSWRIVKHILANIWQLRRHDGPVGQKKVDGKDPKAMAWEIKSKAKKLGAELVGITHIVAEAIFDGRQAPFKHAICIGLSMNREEMSYVPHERAAVEVMRVYQELARIAVKLSEEIRAMGWPAKAYGNPNSTDILHIPLALNAGLGQLGKHGSMICKEFGSNFRLAAVLTDLPLAVDQPIDLAVDDLCLSCKRCLDDCPPDAIFDVKQLVRGVEKWYVDFDKCIYYFVKTHGCAICIEVCPWSEPGRGPWLFERLMNRRKSGKVGNQKLENLTTL
ncbi:MAG: 4Fe-4S dicluster domain-containing protein [bacterium]